jgi:hypothetical protein
MKYKNTLSDKNTTQLIYHMVVDPPILREAKESHNRLLDADSFAVDVPNYVNDLQHLNSNQIDLLLNVLNDHQSLSRGGLGTLKIAPIHLELKADARPYHARSFPMP